MPNFLLGRKEIRLVVLNLKNKGDHDRPIVPIRLIPIHEGKGRVVTIAIATVIDEKDVTVTTVIVKDPLLENLEVAIGLDHDHLVTTKIDTVHERDLILDITPETTVSEIDLELQILDKNPGTTTAEIIVTTIKIDTSIIQRKV